MVVRRRGVLMGLVTVAALALAAGFLWRFADDRGLVSFLLGTALLVVGVVHGIAWRGSRAALLVADMTGLQVRLGAEWVSLPWSEVEQVDVARRGVLGDGRLAVHARDERRVLGGATPRCRLAVVLNRWLYDAALVVPYGLTTSVSVDDIGGELRRLADGRVQVVELADQPEEPQPTVEVAAAGTLTADPDDSDDDDVVATDVQRPWFGTGRQRETETIRDATPPAPRRLAAAVSALRSPGGRRDGSTVPVHAEPSTVGMLALSEPQQETEPLPELEQLRRRAPEDEVVVVPVTTPTPPAGAELVIDVTPDLPAEQAIGEQIRAAREWLGVSVDDLAERTRIRPSVIEAIEVGDFSACGGDFYARGHLRMLAGILGIDAAAILSTYDEHVATAPVSPRAVFDAELSRGVVRPASGGSRWGALIATVLVLLLAWGLAKLFLPEPSDAGGPPPAHASQSHQRTANGRQPAITDPDIGDALPPVVAPTHVTITASGTSRVVVRDASMKIIYEGTLQPGQSAGVSGQGPLRVMASDGGAVKLGTAGHPPVPMGASGVRVFRHVG